MENRCFPSERASEREGRKEVTRLRRDRANRDSVGGRPQNEPARTGPRLSRAFPAGCLVPELGRGETALRRSLRRGLEQGRAGWLTFSRRLAVITQSTMCGKVASFISLARAREVIARTDTPVLVRIFARALPIERSLFHGLPPPSLDPSCMDRRPAGRSAIGSS